MLPIQEFSIDKLDVKLKELRRMRGYKSQGSICEELGITRESWNRWEKKRMPSVESLIKIANHCKINILYFFINNADIEDFDLISKSNRNNLDEKLDSKVMPFVVTGNSKEIFRILSKALKEKELIVFETNFNTGATKAILEFRKASSEPIVILNKSLFHTDYLQHIKTSSLLIIEDMEEYLREDWKLIFTFTKNFSGSVVLTGKKMDQLLKKYGYNELISNYYNLQSITPSECKDMIYAALPGCSREVCSLLGWSSVNMELKALYTLLLKIHKLKETDPNFSLKFEYLLTQLDIDGE